MKELICIVCPRGCHIHVDDNNGYKVNGNKCPRGEEYGRNELLHPARVLTSIVPIEEAVFQCCPVKTDAPIPKERIFQALNTLRGIKLKSHVKEGEIIVHNILGLNVNWVSERTM